MDLFDPLFDWWFFEWYRDLPPLSRLVIALVPITVGTILYFTGASSPWGYIGCWITGGVLLLFAIPSHEESKKNKWGDW